MCIWQILYALRPPHSSEETDASQNVASEYKPDKQLHSKSGTLAYLAPEVYAGTGYLTEVDWWSLGVTFYECIYNKVRTIEEVYHDYFLTHSRDLSLRMATRS